MTETPPPTERFEALFRRHVAAVRLFLYRRGAGDDTEDLLAGCFLIAWRRLDRLPQGHELPWLYNVAAHELANHRRGRRRHAALLERVAATAGPPPAADRPAPGLDPTLHRALLRLPPGDRHLLLLMAWEGLAGDDLARALGISRATLRMRIHRARRRARRALAGEGPPGEATPPSPRPTESTP